jgi:hypothetical protein
MKNVHVLPTDKPSKLIYNDANDLCYQSKKSAKNDRKWMYRKKFHIYITSDEQIKEGDWIYNEEREPSVIQCIGKGSLRGWIKIILTTDWSLDGVQLIDDTFIEWFVKNPSCEEVKVEKVMLSKVEGTSMVISKYKIILPQEEAKQRAANYMALKGALDVKEETLEEAAKIIFPHKPFVKVDITNKKREAFIEGYKLAQQRMYSEEEVIKAYHDAYHKGYTVGQKDAELHPLALTIANNIHIDRNKWFEQFKKKGGDK